MKPFRLVAVCVPVSVLFAVLLVGGAALADQRTEAIAQEAFQKAQDDYAAMNYPAAVAVLKKAVTACGANRCAPVTKATLLRDLGTMEFRAGDKTHASKYFSEALAIEPSLMLNPIYDASDVGSAWEDARAAAGLPAGQISTKPPPGGAGAAPPAAAAPAPAPAAPVGKKGGAAPAPAATAPAPPPEPIPVGEQPTGGDFAHEPALEQREDTPLPIYVEYTGSSKLAKVIVKY